MTRHVELDRRFRDLSKSELERVEFDDPDTLAWFSDGNLGKYEGWPELLQQPRLLLLAEAGSGKTAEMREQAKRLCVQGKFGLFLDLASLAHRSPTELMSAVEEERFSAWKSDSSSTAWFFLDAVDELKLTQGKLETALTSFAKAIGSNLNRVHIVVSCRPTDWRVSIDLATMEERLPYQQTTVPSISTPTQAFLAALENRRDKTKERESGPTKPEDIRVVSLLPLGARQIELLARELGVNDPSRFIAEIDKQHAWWLARRPLDLSELVATWNDLKSLGTRAQQHESNVTAKLKDGPGRPGRGVLSEAKARVGAEQVALALALTRKLTISAPELAADVIRAGDALDLAEVLQDWSEDERQSLLRRALFDPATYGRVRFHNRSVQEFLAARRLVSLKSKGMPTKALLRLLFAERYDVPTVIPSRKPIAAWLSLWNDDVRRELLVREPETLLALGDPESLPLETRAALLRAFSYTYGQGDGRGINIPIDEVRRLAHPSLGKIVRELWGDGTANEDVRELLLELIWKGAIGDCTDIAEQAAYNQNYPASDRTTAISALIACKDFLGARKVVGSMLSDAGLWPPKVIHDTVSDLFPDAMSARDLRVLIEMTPEPQRAVGGFEWALRTIVGRLDASLKVATELRDQLAEVVWGGRNSNLEWHRISSRFGHVTPALAILCEHLLSAGLGVGNADHIRACIIAERFSEQAISRGEFVEALRTHFKEGKSLRAATFWAELAIMDELCSHKGLWDRIYHVLHGTLLVNVTEADRPWLEVALVDGSAPERREVALELLLRLWHQRGRRKKEAKTLLLSVKADSELYELALRQTAPLVADPAMVRFEQSNKRRNRDHEDREKKRLQGWTNWRDKLLAKPSAAFSRKTLNKSRRASVLPRI